MGLKIILFEDNDKLRESLSFLLNNFDDFEVVGSYDNCIDTIAIINKLQPDLVLMDIDLPGETGIVGVQKVKVANPETIVIIYTVFEDDDNLFKCLCAGANGYLLKKTNPSKLFDAIHEAMAGGAPMSPGIAKKVIATFRTGNATEAYQLSKRELQVLQLLSQGYSIKKIAAELFLAFDTVRSHLKSIYSKLHVGCGKEAITKAFKERLL